MDTLVKFGVGTSAYIFQQDRQVSLSHNFADTVQQSVRVIGLDGGLQPFGTGRAPSAMGNLVVQYFLLGTSNLDVKTQVDALRKLAHQGMRKLFIRHAGKLMWTWATVSNVRGADNVQDIPHLRQRVELNFQCVDAKWYYVDGGVHFSDGLAMDDGLTMPILKLPLTSVGNNDTVNVTNYGNSPVAPYIRWDIPTGVTATNPTLTWSNADGNIVYSVQYTASLTAGDVVIIDCARLKVSPTFSNLTITHGAWFEIYPGVQTLTVTGTFSANVDLTIQFPDGWI